MLNNHKLVSLCIGLLFVIVLQKFGTPEPVFRFLVPAFVVYCAAASYYNYKFLIKTNQYNFWALLRPLMLFCAGFGIFLVFPTEGLRGLFLISAVLVITSFEILLGKQAENLLLNQTLFIAFGFFITLFGANFYFPAYGPIFLAASFFVALLLTRSFYDFIPQSDQIKNLNSLIISLFSAEIFWVLSFLPFHFSVLGLLLFNFFYFCVILNFYSLFHILNAKKMQFHLLLILVTSLLALFVTPWKIIS